jgi:archaellin
MEFEEFSPSAQELSRLASQHTRELDHTLSDLSARDKQSCKILAEVGSHAVYWRRTPCTIVTNAILTCPH